MDRGAGKASVRELVGPRPGIPARGGTSSAALRMASGRVNPCANGVPGHLRSFARIDRAASSGGPLGRTSWRAEAHSKPTASGQELLERKEAARGLRPERPLLPISCSRPLVVPSKGLLRPQAALIVLRARVTGGPRTIVWLLAAVSIHP